MIYTGILIAFWLALRIGSLLTIRIENIEIGTDSLTKCGLPQYLKLNIRMQKNSTSYKLFRLWSYSDVDIEVCPVFHLCLWLKMTSWVSGYVLRRPLTGTKMEIMSLITLSVIMCPAHCFGLLIRRRLVRCSSILNISAPYMVLGDHRHN
jgi:hypothetical protein